MANGDLLILLDFPTPISETDVLWRLSGDILEIEYVGEKSSLYYNFLVPRSGAPEVEYGPYAFAARFRKPHAGESDN